MRYIYYIAAIFLVFSLFIAFQLRGGIPQEKKAALSINDRIITPEEFDKLYASRDPHLEERDDFINALITKELLIQEARRGGIDREEPFRQSIQNFYEQSLVKILLDRKFASFPVNVEEEEVRRYAELLHKKLHVTLFSYGSAEEARKAPPVEGEKKVLLFEELSREMRCSILALKEGQTCGPHRINGKYVILKLDRVEDSGSPHPRRLEPSVIEKMLMEDKKEKFLNDWLDDLRKKSSIRINVAGNSKVNR